MGPHENGEAAPTQKKTKRDANALMKGKSDWKSADGEIIIRNISPKNQPFC
jgi:hypothetical protein